MKEKTNIRIDISEEDSMDSEDTMDSETEITTQDILDSMDSLKVSVNALFDAIQNMASMSE